jgi:tetratricopeptide (TPR) repeat protein/V8-like Glu-specific endopeptidase
MLKFGSFLLVAAIPLAPVFLVWGTVTPVVAIAPEDVARIAKPLAVLIESAGANGSGVIIAKAGDRYTILTAAHVVTDKQRQYTLRTSDGKEYTLANSTIRSFPQNVDLAIAEFTSPQSYGIAKLGNSDNAIEGSMAFVSGYPRTTSTITSSVYSFREGRIVANSAKPLQSGYAIIYSAHTLPGMSGGGVFNDKGELIAIHGRGDVDAKFQADDINPNVRFKTGNDLGIPINTYAKMVASVTAAPTVAAQPATVPRSTAASDQFVQGVGQAQVNNHRGALENYTRAIRIKPDYAAAYLNRSIARAELGDTSGSVEDQNRSLALNPQQSEVYFNRASLLYQQGDKAGALANYSRAIALQSNEPLAYYNRAIIYGEMEKWAEAVADYDRVISFNDQYVAAYYNRGIGNTKLGRWQAAIQDFDRAIQLRPNYPQALNNRGNLKTRSGDNAGAIADYSQAIALQPTYALAYSNRASAHLNLRRRAEALADLKKAAELYRSQGNQERYEDAIGNYRRIGGT